MLSWVPFERAPLQDLEGVALGILQTMEAAKSRLLVKSESMTASHDDFKRKQAEVRLWHTA